MSDKQPITKRKLLTIYPTASAIARAVGVTESYVSKWEMDEPIPKYQELLIRHELRPDIPWDLIQVKADKRAA